MEPKETNTENQPKNPSKSERRFYINFWGFKIDLVIPKKEYFKYFISFLIFLLVLVALVKVYIFPMIAAGRIAGFSLQNLISFLKNRSP